MGIKNLLFIGPCEYGSTSRMRYNIFSEILNVEIELIDTSDVISSTNRILRSIGWRYKVGPLISGINKLINNVINSNQKNYDVIWIEKGVFIKPDTIRSLKKKTFRLIHYTPDPAFYYHQSRFFNRALSLYDFTITTKSFEIDLYKQKTEKRVIFCTQGYDVKVHKPHYSFDEKKYDVCFIGHHEIQREKIINSILNLGISVAIAGIKWEKFARNHEGNVKLHYFGSNVAGEEYAKLISASKMGLGLLSKWIPEKHTTRTFEIPACGTALLTERNPEIDLFFNESEVIFFENEKDIPELILKYLEDDENLKTITLNGYQKVLNGDFTYKQILTNALKQIISN